MASRNARALLGGMIALLLLTGVTLAYVRQPVAPVSADTALERFRSATPEAGTSPAVTAVADPSAQPAARPDPSEPVAASATPGPAAPATAASPTAPATAASPTAPAPPAPGGPTPVPKPRAGVYSYRTTGYEEVDALGGSRHDYPETTYMTIRDKGCGVVMRWQPLEERWDESDVCPEGADIALHRFATYHEFFQQGMQQDYDCAPGSHVHRGGAPPGTEWRWRCEGEHGAIETAVRVVGAEPVTVGGTTVEAMRVRYSSVVTGSNRGTQEQERWFDLRTGLMVRIQTDVLLQVDTPFGPTGYREQYRIDLLSLEPQT